MMFVICWLCCLVIFSGGLVFMGRCGSKKFILVRDSYE